MCSRRAKVDAFRDFKIDSYSSLERTAEEILSDRNEIVQLDRRRNDNRMGIRHLMKIQDKTSWLVMGNTFFRFESSRARKMLEEDQRTLDTEINTLRDGMGKKVDKMRDLEGQPALRGFNLKPLDSNEMKAINQVMGRVE